MKPRKRKKRALQRSARHFSIKEGAFATIRNSLGNSYIAPFAVAINSSNSLIAMLTSITGLLGPITQWRSSRLLEKHSRKKILLTSVFIEALIWIPIMLIAFLFYKGILLTNLPFFLLLFFSIFIIFASIGAPAWFSWMGDVVDAKYRGKWFSKRNLIIGIFTLIFTIAAAFFLDFAKQNNYLMFGFIILFFLAMISRLICCYYFKKAYEPKLRIKDKHYFSFSQFLKKAPSNNFGRFTLFRACLEFTAYIGTPFFTVYMLRTLNFSYTTLMIVVLSQTLFGLFVMKWWGKFADKFGNYKTLQITSIIVSIYPAFWLISKSPIFLIFVPGLMKGVFLGGFNLSAVNFIYDSVKKEKRGLAVSYYSLLIGIGIFLGAGLGAILVKVLTINFMNIFLFLFLVSAIARTSVSLIMLPLFKEAKKKTQKFSSEKLLKSLIPKRVKLPSFEDAHELFIHRNH